MCVACILLCSTALLLWLGILCYAGLRKSCQRGGHDLDSDADSVVMGVPTKRRGGAAAGKWAAARADGGYAAVHVGASS